MGTLQMKSRTQTIIIGFLIVLLACQKMICPVTNYLMLPFARILVFVASVYLAVAVNPMIGLLIALIALQAMREFYVVEHMAISDSVCECPTGYEYDKELKKCKNKDNKYVNATTCTCSSGYAYNINTGQCEQSSVMSSPIPAVGPAPAGTEEVTPTIPVGVPVAASTGGSKIELSPAEKNAALGREAPPA
jgi:hypothetical protein